MTTLPRFVAFCGNPTSGKTTAAEILAEIYGHALVDDGAFLRKIAIDHFGATWEDVHTQEGKLRTTTVAGVEMTWRDVLGRIGNGIENQFGPDSIPELAYRGLNAGTRYCFGSVRREQGWYHRGRGAFVIELNNPLAPPSPYEFDTYSKKAVHITVENDGLARGLAPAAARYDLRCKLVTVMGLATDMIRGMAA